ncbi:GNAT family N-acetyltransferase [Bacillus ndiopicus]|uniref:GNAT family N-acetyltransferase n=1 Tax=Bacillus ndiopicus TaxID=1347368 RepID=UPI0005AAA6D9|nr:GNAT family N-acetyltransferase [Bacillus ndiopicus]
MEFKQIYKEDYSDGKPFIYQYTSTKFYDVRRELQDTSWTLKFTLKDFETPFEKSLEGKVFEDHLENIECYIAFEGDIEMGVMSFSHEKWNNTIRLNDIHVYPEAKRRGVGTVLMNIVKQRAKEIGARAIVLETQTSNYPAICFYQKHGFSIIGCDLISYTNKDIEKHEVRLELGYIVI